MICRDKDRNIEIFALSIDWKKLLVTTWKPMMSIVAQQMRIAGAVSAITVGSSVNARVINSGTVITERNPTAQATVA